MNKRIVINIFVTITCLLSVILCLMFNSNEEYKYCFIFPLPFIAIYFTYFVPCFKKQITPFKLFFCVLIYIRYVILPIGNCIYGYVSFANSKGSTDDYATASIVTILELIILNLFLMLSSNTKIKKTENNKEKYIDKISGNNTFIIWIFVLLIFLIFLINKKLWNAVYFIAPTEDVSERFSHLNDSEQLIVYLFNIAKQFLFLIVVDKLSKKYNKEKNIIYVFIALVFIVLNILIYTGTNRAEFVITIISTCCVIFEIFPKFKKIIIVGGLLASFMIIPQISNYRNAALVSDDFRVKDFAQLGNIYMAGLDNVALSIKTSGDYTQYKTLKNFTFDMTRGIIGVGFFMKNVNGMLTSRLFNYSFFGPYSKNSSQIIPISGQGYYYFNIYGFFIIEIVFAFIAIKLEKHYCIVKDIKLKYFLLNTLLRLAMMQCLNGTVLFNRLSYDLLVPLILIIISGMISTKRRTIINEEELS